MVIYFPLSAATKNECFKLQALVNLEHVLQKSFVSCSVGTALWKAIILERQANSV